MRCKLFRLSVDSLSSSEGCVDRPKAYRSRKESFELIRSTILLDDF